MPDKVAASTLHSVKVAIRCGDYDASRAFYTTILGLRIVEEWDQPEGKGFIVALGAKGAGGFVEVMQVPADSPQYVDAFAEPTVSDKIDLQLRTTSVDQWATLLRGRWPFRGPEDRPWGHRYLWLRDPDQVQIVLFEGAV